MYLGASYAIPNIAPSHFSMVLNQEVQRSWRKLVGSNKQQIRWMSNYNFKDLRALVESWNNWNEASNYGKCEHNGNAPIH